MALAMLASWSVPRAALPCEAQKALAPAAPTLWSLDPHTLMLSTPGGEALLSLEPSLQTGYHALERALGRRRPLALAAVSFEDPFAHTLASGAQVAGMVAHTREATHSITYQLAPSSPHIDITLVTTYHEDVSVRAEQLSFEFQGATLTGRAHTLRQLRLGGAARALVVDAHTPRDVRVEKGGEVLVWDGSGVSGVVLGVRGERARVTFELDHREHHPFKVYAGCPDSAHALPSQWRDETPRLAGESVTRRVTLTLGEAGQVSARRYPEGYQAVIAMTDHADQGSAARTRALAYGAQDAPASSSRGWVGRGLGYSKSVFSIKQGGYKPQLDDPAFVTLLEQLRRDGVETGLHSVSGKTDTRAQSEAYIEKFARDWGGPVWIDHGPERNCEAISNQGWDASSEYHVVDLLLANGIDVWWAVLDVSLHGSKLDMLAKRPAARRVVAWPQRMLARGWRTPVLFASAWFFVARRAFLARFAARHLDALVRDHGLLFAHTYLDVWAERGKFVERSLLERKEGKLRLRDDVDEVFARLASYQSKRLILMQGVGRLAPHLLDAMRMVIRQRTDGAYELTHTGGRPLRGVTLRLPASAGAIFVDGTPHTRMSGGKEQGHVDIWLDFAPHQTRLLELSGAARRAPEGARLAAD